MVDRFLDSYPIAVQELKYMGKKDQQSGRKETPILVAAKIYGSDRDGGDNFRNISSGHAGHGFGEEEFSRLSC